VVVEERKAATQECTGERLAEAPTQVSSPLRKLLLFAAPIGAASLLYPLSGSLTSIWIGRYLGEDEFAASVSVYLAMALVLALLVGIASAAGVLTAQRWGAGDLRGAGRVARAALRIHLMLTIVCCAAGWLGAHSALTLMGLAEHQLQSAVPYFRIQLIALLPISILQIANALLRSTGDSKTGFKATTLALVIASAVMPLLIFGIGVFPRLGLAGAALAELLAYTTAVCVMVLRVRRSRHPLAAALQEAAGHRLDLRSVSWIVPRGLAMGVQSIVSGLAALGVTMVTNRYDSHTTAAFAAAAQLWGYIQIPAFAISIAVTNHVAQAVGAHDRDAARAFVNAGMTLVAITLGPLILIGYLIDEVMLRAFLPSGSPSLQLAVHVNSIVLWSFALYAIALVFLGACRAAGAALAPLLIVAVSLVGIRFAILFFAVPGDSAAIAWSISLSMAACMILSLWYFIDGRWRAAPR
jgi:putative MATE family efflux protein